MKETGNRHSKLKKILIKDHQEVKKDDILMVLQSKANFKDVLKLKKIIDSISPNDFTFPLNEASKFKLGGGETNNFTKAFQDEKLLLGFNHTL